MTPFWALELFLNNIYTRIGISDISTRISNFDFGFQLKWDPIPVLEMVGVRTETPEPVLDTDVPVWIRTFAHRYFMILCSYITPIERTIFSFKNCLTKC